MTFPKNFIWGAAAASYQIEGGAYEDGKGLSVWDTFCQTPGKIYNGNTGNIACDHYHRYQEDAALMGQIGLNAYRLSICWPRVIPEGIGTLNPAGLDFYDRLIDALLEHDVQPWVTLFHWDYPHALYQRGGWLNPDSPDWFAGYTAVIVDKLSDRVQHWMTQNEPQVYLGLGHQLGIDAPGLKLSWADVLMATHHSHLAHGKAVQVIRARAKRQPLIGAAPIGAVSIPATNRPEDIAAARQAMFSVTRKDCWNCTWVADPLILGHYPEDGLQLYQAEMPHIKAGDMETICQPLDFYGFNIYRGNVVQAAADGRPEHVPEPAGAPLTSMEWRVTPSVLYWGPRFLYDRYQLPIVVTENGMGNLDWVHLDGKVHDPQRIDFLTRYLSQYKRVIADGVEAWGYFQWSIMDNFEWSSGYKRRFGLIYVDFESQQRILKDSAHWYSEVIKCNGEVIP